MKNQNKGFIVPVIIVAVLAIIGGTYFYLQSSKKTVVQVSQIENNVDTARSPVDSTPTGSALYQNTKYKFSIQYPSTKYAADKQVRDNGIYLHPIAKTAHFYPDNVTLIFNANDVDCSRFGDYKKIDGQTLTAGTVVFQHTSETAKTPMNKLIDNYEVFEKYFASKDGKCYSATLHTYTSLSKLDMTDPRGNRTLSDAQIQQQLAQIDVEVTDFKSDFKNILNTFKFEQ